ncbi:N-acetylmuramoyl-L-alanine amidase [Prevotella intermedia]|uniref:N-acetylmuramoyl-L-alanine amidase n=1 Tax=Prevotella intermedia TaxID=28131 RepID=A0A2G9ICV6_PREIN|nr:N-acetylmuramoyl-L-alanine amidase [Prevotella intermedia]PIN27597.1 N-acetylmuramoyl-L-alanine amidase [Prevotella intermedia]
MRDIKYIAVHCTASNQSTTVAMLLSEFKRKGWKNPGYHYVVTADGKIHQLLAEDNVSNGVKGYNSISINVAYVGGIGESGKAVDNRTPLQKLSLRKLLSLLKKKYPKAIIQGHRDFSPDKNGNGKVDVWERIKECPCFDAKVEYKDL